MLSNNKAIMEEYIIPENIKELADKKFIEQFYEELHRICGFGLDDFEIDTYFNMEGTSAYSVSLANTCKKLKQTELAKYLKSIDWIQSDVFDDFLLDRMVEEKLVLPEFEDDEIERQLGIPASEIRQCMKCGKYFHNKDVIDLIDTKTKEPLCVSECLTCNSNGELETKPLEIDRKEAIKFYLGLEEKDYFYCENCKKFHLNKFKTESGICEHCQIQAHSTIQNANSYYRRALKASAKWMKEIEE